MTKDPYTYLVTYSKAWRGRGAFSPEEVITNAARWGIAFQDQRQWGRIFRQAAKDGYIRPSTKLFPRSTSNGSKRPGWIAC